jgi:hypothetical protein
MLSLESRKCDAGCLPITPRASSTNSGDREISANKYMEKGKTDFVGPRPTGKYWRAECEN